MIPQRRRETNGQRNIPKPATLRRRDLPFQADRCTQTWRLTKSMSPHSSATISPSRKPASPARARAGTHANLLLGGDDQALELVEIIEARRLLGDAQQPDRTWHPLDDLPFHGFLQHHVQHGQDVVDRLLRLRAQAGLQALGVLGRDRVKGLVSQRRNEMDPNDRFLGRDSTWLLPIGLGVAVDKSRRELSQRWHLLFGSGRPCCTKWRSRSSAHR